MTKEAEDGSLTDHHVTLCQASLQFGEGEIGLSIHPSLDLTPVRLQCVPFIAAKFLRANVPSPSPACIQPRQRVGRGPTGGQRRHRGGRGSVTKTFNTGAPPKPTNRR